MFVRVTVFLFVHQTFLDTLHIVLDILEVNPLSCFDVRWSFFVFLFFIIIIHRIQSSIFPLVHSSYYCINPLVI
jgi:E3 ubiquitin-protein ligase DOA10